MLKLTTDEHEPWRGLSATAELLVQGRVNTGEEMGHVVGGPRKHKFHGRVFLQGGPWFTGHV